MAPLPAINVSTRIKNVRSTEEYVRRPVAVSVGIHIEGASLLHADPGDVRTMIAGVFKRVALKPPECIKSLREEIRAFVDEWLHTNMKPLPASTDLGVPHWLEESKLPYWRKKQILEAHLKCLNIFEKRNKRYVYFLVKSFMKDEFYEVPKFPRGINARVDEFKAEVGPMFHAIEKELFKRPEFVKYVPVCDRPRFLFESLYGHSFKYMSSDYTAFESCFTPEMMADIEFQLYDYMLENLSGKRYLMKLCRLALAGKNEIQFKFFQMVLEGTRMSGEMCTSLGNGFSNLMFMLFTFKRIGVVPKIEVEGDDSLSAASKFPPDSMFEELGLRIKMEAHQRISEASFCGLVFDEVDLVNLADPIKAILKFGWAPARYFSMKLPRMSALRRVKALSMLYQYNGAPILTAFSLMALRLSPAKRCHMLRFINSNSVDQFTREMYIEAFDSDIVPKNVGIGSRLVVEEKFGVTMLDQRALEEEFDMRDALGPIRSERFLSYCKNVQCEFYSNYVLEVEDPVLRGRLWVRDYTDVDIMMSHTAVVAA